MSKRKDLIISKYQDLKIQLSEYINNSLFPSLDDYQLSDIVFFLNMYFPKYTDDHSITIKNLLKENNIELDEVSFINVNNIISNFISFLNNI